MIHRVSLFLWTIGFGRYHIGTDGPTSFKESKISVDIMMSILLF